MTGKCSKGCLPGYLRTDLCDKEDTSESSNITTHIYVSDMTTTPLSEDSIVLPAAIVWPTVITIAGVLGVNVFVCVVKACMKRRKRLMVETNAAMTDQTNAIELNLANVVEETRDLKTPWKDLSTTRQPAYEHLYQNFQGQEEMDYITCH